MFKVNNKSTTTTSFPLYRNQSIDLQSETIVWFLYDGERRRSGVFIVNFEHISLFSSVSIVDFEQVNVG